MHVFKHPKFYEEFRQRAKRCQKELRERNKSDQVISKSSHDGESERAPGPGHKPQATSSKPQAPSIKLSNQPEQATSHKLQAPSNKRQA